MKLITLVILAAMTTSADARVALKDDVVIEDGLKIVAIGKVLYRGCDNIAPRRLKALSFARSLQKRAQSLGYSNADIDAYLDSEPDKDRVKAKARAYLVSKGADLSVTTSLCAVGAAEINQETSVGRFLRLR